LVSPKFIVAFFLISSLALGPLPTQAALRYVDPDHGSDARGDATKENPVKTIEKAFDFAKTGDTLYLETGTFSSIVLPKALGIWGNQEDKPTIKGPVEFSSQVTALVDLHYRDFVLTGSEGFTFAKSLAIDGVSFDRLEFQVEGSGVFIGGQGQLNVSGDGLTFNSLHFTQSGSGSSKALDISVSSGPVILMDIVAEGNNQELSFNIATKPRNVQVKNVTFSNQAHLSISNPSGLLITQCSFIKSGLSIAGGRGTIEFSSFSDISKGSVLDIVAPTIENGAIEYEIMNNTFKSVYKGLDLSSIDETSSVEVTFENNILEGADRDVLGIIFAVDGSPIDAKHNWFGSNSGPFDYLCNPDGQGATVHPPGDISVDNILYRPWCGDPECSTLITARSACAAGDDPSSYIQDDADSMNPWGMSILIIAVCAVSYLVFLVIFFFVLKLRQAHQSGSEKH